MSTVLLWLGIAALGLGTAMIVTVFLVANLADDVERVSLRTANLMVAFWTVGPWLLYAALCNFILFLLWFTLDRVIM